MPRIRTLKPEFWSNEKLATVTPYARLLAIALLNYADDEGFFNANERLVHAFAFPLEASVKVHGLLTELSSIDYIKVHNTIGGKAVGCVVNFGSHQAVNRARRSVLRKEFEAALKPPASLTEPSVSDHGILTEPSVTPPIRNGMEWNGRGDAEEDSRRPASRTRFVPPSVEEVAAHVAEKGYTFNPKAFVAFYASKGWKMGKTPMTDWKQACVTWQLREEEQRPATGAPPPRTLKEISDLAEAEQKR